MDQIRYSSRRFAEVLGLDSVEKQEYTAKDLAETREKLGRVPPRSAG